LGIGAGVAAVAGGVLVGVGEIKIATADEPNSTKVVADNSDSFAQGAAILGGSLGLGLSSIVAKVGTKRRRWYVPLVGGLISAIGGGVWYGLTTKAQQAQLEADATNGKAEPPWITSMRANVYASTILTGLGAGMVIGATGGVLANRRTKRRRSARLQIFPSGATIKIRF